MAGALAGVVLATFVLVACLSFGSLIFAGELAPFVPQGIGLGLVTALVVGVVVAWRSSLPGSVAIPQDRVVPILGLMSGALAAKIPADVDPRVQCVTILVVIALTSLFTGVGLYLLGRFQLGNLIRFIPFPVVGGFLAGSGWLLSLGAVRVATGHPVSLAGLAELLSREDLPRWGAAMAFGALLFAVQRRYRRPVLVPILLVAAFLLFHGVAWLAGFTLAGMRDSGWLMTLPPGGNFAPLTWNFSNLGLVDWSAIPVTFGLMATVLLTAVISILLTASSLELVTQTEIDLNQELRAAGLANLCSAAIGGLPGFHSLSLSRLAHDLGSRTRLAAVVSAVLCGLTFLSGPSWLGWLPRFLVAGLLFFLGLGFLAEWAWDSRRKLPWADYLVVLLILAVVGTAGYLAGVAFGLVAAVVLFIHSYSRVGAVNRALTGAEQPSNVERPLSHERLLRECGAEIHLLKLHGFLFFGTANGLVREIRRRCADPQLPKLRYVILDFRRVTGLDSSTTLSLSKVRLDATSRGFLLVFSTVAGEVRRQLSLGGFETETGAGWRFFPDLDHAMEWCENDILQRHHLRQDDRPETVVDLLEANWLRPGGGIQLQKYLRPRTLKVGEKLIQQGDSAEAMYFVESGEFTALLELVGGRVIRLRRQGAGTVVGELGLLLGVRRTATVLAERDSLVHELRAGDLQRMKSEDPELAAEFYQVLARWLAEKLVHTNQSLRAQSE